MATLVLSAAGAAFGGSFGGSVFGLSSLALGKAAGATIGSFIDEKLLGAGATPVESGRIDRLRIMGSSEGAPLPRVFGRMRIAGQLIWSSRFLETVSTERAGGKATRGAQQTVNHYGYTVSLAVALCEGEVMRVGRIWADGQPLAQAGITWRLHSGAEEQLPDPLVAAVEGAANAPAYRGTAYVVFEDLDLGPFGNRIPQFNFEVFRRPKFAASDAPRPAALDIKAVALVPGTGEYALATVPVSIERGRGDTLVANVNNDRGLPDLVASLEQLEAELPSCAAVSLVVSWFGDDLRAERCSLYPAVEQSEQDADAIAWSVSGLDRANARAVSRVDGRPLFGGTPADESVLQAIRHLSASGKAVMFYPFVLMDILPGNGLEDPLTPGSDQPAVPWRGRITLSRGAGIAGSPDKSPAAKAEVDAFFGAASPSDFEIAGGRVVYTGPAEWSYRRFVLHYAHLCSLAGGVEAFCVGSEMRGLTQIRDGAASYPAVSALRQLASDVRSVLGPDVKIGYAADWSEYFGHHPQDGSGDVLFHLDPLWADPSIDFIGIDNYMPLSDWRDGEKHRDADAGSIYSLDYLKSNVAGGEGFDWYYLDAAARELQLRTEIADSSYGQPWTFRYKDLVGWWSNAHFNRLGGMKAAEATPWVPRSKPFWFTELGCPAVDKGTNQPNVFFDPKSSESFFPFHSNGQRDDLIQQRYLQAVFAHWGDETRNPRSDVYGGRMVDMAKAFVWAWDARPWPDFPWRTETWSDGENHERGHWLNGRISNPELAEVARELCERSGLPAVSTACLHGSIAGYIINGIETPRQSLQPLMLTYGLNCHVEGARLVVSSRTIGTATVVAVGDFATVGQEPRITRTRSSDAETADRISLSYIRADRDYQAGAAEASSPRAAEPSTSESALPIVLSAGEAEGIALRWLAESRTARETTNFSLPLSRIAIGVGDVITMERAGRSEFLRVDKIVQSSVREITAVRIERQLYDYQVRRSAPAPRSSVEAPGPAHVEFLDLPLLTGEEVPHAPYVAVLSRPWTGPIALYSSVADAGYTLNRVVDGPAIMGRLLDPMPSAQPGVWAQWGGRVRLDWGTLATCTLEEVLNGYNAAALRFGAEADWEIIQFASAELVQPDTYRLDRLLRGQSGTDGVMPPLWPIGTDFVLLNNRVRQIELAGSARGLVRHFRYGPAHLSHSHPCYGHRTARFTGVGLRPYAPAHVAAVRTGGRDVLVTWVRRTRLDGDSWEGFEVPVGEERMAFQLRISGESGPLRIVNLSGTDYLYTGEEQVADAASESIIFEVAQVSDRFGAGPFRKTVV